jgi:POT family proton-dependent oligopeptide transporter
MYAMKAVCPGVSSLNGHPNAEDVLGHPRGLIILAGTELWDRISFHGMQALLVLYMAELLFAPGHIEHVAGLTQLRAAIEGVTGPLSSRALASQIFGLYVGLIYLLPVFGGMLGDRVLGRRRAVILGALLMTAGHVCMTFDDSFLAALLLLILGAGALRGNLVSQFGDLYAKDDPRRESGFQIYYAVLNSAAFLAPIVTGILSQRYGWHYGFGFAAIGMLAGLVIYLVGGSYLPADKPRRVSVARRRLTAVERRVVVVMLLMIPILSLFWIAQSQIWNTYNLWVRDHVDLMIGGWRIPVPWLQAVDGLAAVVMIPPVLSFWRWQASRSSEPDEISKLSIGCFTFGFAVVWLAVGQWLSAIPDKVPLGWALGFHALSGIGYIYFVPIGVAFFSRSAPATVNAMMIGVYYLSAFIGSTVSGRLGGLYECLPATEFWLLHAAIVIAGGLLLLLLGSRLRRELVREDSCSPRPCAV